MSNSHHYNCRDCRQWEQRKDGSYGCYIIDDSHGREYPIATVLSEKSLYMGESVCEYYEPKNPPENPHVLARKINVGGRVKKCSACKRLVHKAAKVCPHCSAEFIEVIEHE